MLVVLIAGGVVLALILTLWARDRMYETGVLLAIGESKAKVVMQYVSEVLIVAVLAFALSLASGELVAQKVGDRLLQQEIVAQQPAAAGLPFGAGGRIGMGGARGGPGALTGRVAEISPDVVDEIDVRVTPSAAGSMFGAGLLVVALSAAMPSLAVMRYKPKTILSKAN
jgi:putative ABC transport system permease protein